jgi:laccase
VLAPMVCLYSLAFDLAAQGCALDHFYIYIYIYIYSVTKSSCSISSFKIPIGGRFNGDLNIAGTTYRWMVDYGKTYLLRVVNAVMNAELFFAVAGHNLTVVGMDGHYIKPISTSYIMISPGQTMNVLLTANQTLGHYYIAARQYSSEDPAVTGFDHVNTTAILQYRGNYTITSSPSFPSTLPLYLDFIAASNFTNRIRSLANKDYPINVPLNITKRMYITVSMNSLYCSTCSGGDGGSIIGTSMNNISWLNPSTDVLHAYYRFFPISQILFLSNMPTCLEI